MSNIMVGAALLAIALVACSSDDDDGTTKANACATPSATYVLHASERPNGTCGANPDQVVNVTPDGAVATSDVACASTVQDGCTGRNTSCVVTVSGVTCTSTSGMTFAADGTTATGVLRPVEQALHDMREHRSR